MLAKFQSLFSTLAVFQTNCRTLCKNKLHKTHFLWSASTLRSAKSISKAESYRPVHNVWQSPGPVPVCAAQLILLLFHPIIICQRWVGQTCSGQGCKMINSQHQSAGAPVEVQVTTQLCSVQPLQHFSVAAFYDWCCCFQNQNAFLRSDYFITYGKLRKT